uniref:bL35m n=1 Tax=Polytomella magna TaxID=353565 RepID=UPI002240E3C4|nr:Chain AC, bL35m [Polytomella magna]8APN_AC Chain AC, bL35m [Polytomella magna]8APO_AC Chain AC, bL35m [Polytomella magna]
VFAEVKPRQNPQNHTHEKYKIIAPQPKYDWLVGRFIVDRNNVVWHRQANRNRNRHKKTAGALTRLKRWKPLHKAYAKKLLKLGFKRRFWTDPDPQMVPGFFDPSKYKPRERLNGKPNLRPDIGCPALRQSQRPLKKLPR